MKLARVLTAVVVTSVGVLAGSTAGGAPTGPQNASREAVEAIYANAVALHLVDIIFDVNGVSRASAITGAELSSIETQLTSMGAFIGRRYSVHRESIERVVDRPLPSTLPPIKVAVRPDLDVAVLASSGSQCDPLKPSADLRVVFSLQSLEALLRGGLAAAYQAPSHIKPLHAEGDSVRPSDAELARRYRAMGSALRSFEGQLKPLELGMLALGFQQVEGPLEGTLLFVMAHEIGHLVLRHACNPCPQSETAFQGIENDADYLAVTLTLSTMLEFIPAPELQNDFDGSNAFIGQAAFLQQGYERLLVSRQTRGGTCPSFDYPSLHERATAGRVAIEDVLRLRAADQQAASRSALEQHIESISKKYEDRAAARRQ